MVKHCPLNNAIAFVWLLLLLLLPYSNSYSFNGYQIKDLNDDSTFAQDALAWGSSIAIRTSNIYSSCGGTLLLGGYGVLGGSSQRGEYFYRTYSNLPAHNFIHYSITFWAIDSWDTGHSDGFYMRFDSTAVSGWYMDLTNFNEQLCGAGWNEAKNIRIFGTVAHTATSLTIQFVSDLNEDSQNESFGFRDIALIFDQSYSVPSNSMCGYATSVTLPNNRCSCQEGQYYSGGCNTCDSKCASCYGSSPSQCYECSKSGSVFWDGSKCVSCASQCATCDGSSSTQCLTCTSGYSYFAWTNECLLDCPYPLYKTTDGTGKSICASPCSTTSDFIYWDKSCSATCNSPLQQIKVKGVVSVCKYPCNPTEYLFWDGSCQHDCWGPLDVRVQKGVQYCDYICTNEFDYLYWNRSCLSTCNSPFLAQTLNGKQFCAPPCGLTYYLYPDGSCMDTCSGYLVSRTTGGIKYCDFPCNSSFPYLYWNGSCKTACDFPLVTRVEHSNSYCDYPTNTTDYLYWDGTNFSNCSSPLTPRTEGSPARKFCDYTCNGWDYMYWNGSCFADCPFPLLERIYKGKKFCDYNCTGGDYLFWNGTCLPNCTTPLTFRNESGKRFCDNSAAASGAFLYWDGNLTSDCPSPLVQRSEGTAPYIIKYCDFPCNSSSDYLYWNGSCHSSCNPPLTNTTSNSRSYCHFPCSSQQYLYPNGTCSSLCDAPFVQATNGAEKFCYPTCVNPGDFYYWNNTCLSSCPSPLKKQTLGDVTWCFYPCMKDQFLLSDGSCTDTCDSPLAVSIDAEYKYCKNPCPSPQYLFYNGTCLTSCDSPFRIKNGYLCVLPCDSPIEYYYEQTGECKQECESPSLNNEDLYLRCLPPVVVIDYGTLLDVLLEAPTDPGTSTLVVIPPVLQYIRYLDMPMPYRLERLSMSQGRSILSLRLGQKMSDDMRAVFSKRSLSTEIFENREVKLHFVVNFWEEITSLSIMVTVAIFLAIFEHICKLREWTTIETIFGYLKNIIKWSFCLVLISTSVGKIILFSSIEYRSMTTGSSFSVLSLELSLIMIGVFLVLLIATIYLVHIFQVARRKSSLYSSPGELEEFHNKWRAFQILYRGFKQNNILNRLFFLVYLIRIALPMLIASLLFASPLTQAILYFLLSIVIIIYLIIQKPVMRRINHIQLMVVESIILVVNFCLLLLKSLHISNSKNSHLISALGDVVVGGNSCINLVALMFLFVKVVVGIRTIYLYHKSQKAPPTSKQRVVYLQLLAFVVQQGGMGFEEIFVSEYAAKIFDDPNNLIETKSVEDQAERQILLKNKVLRIKKDESNKKESNKKESTKNDANKTNSIVEISESVSILKSSSLMKINSELKGKSRANLNSIIVPENTDDINSSETSSSLLKLHKLKARTQERDQDGASYVIPTIPLNDISHTMHGQEQNVIKLYQTDVETSFKETRNLQNAEFEKEVEDQQEDQQEVQQEEFQEEQQIEIRPEKIDEDGEHKNENELEHLQQEYQEQHDNDVNENMQEEAEVKEEKTEEILDLGNLMQSQLNKNNKGA